MCVERVNPTDAGVTALLDKATTEPVILKTENSGDFALLPLDDDVIDLLLERNPRLIAECREIGDRMAQGKYLTHKQALEALGEEEGVS
jgi:hypothetical protein